MYPTAIPSVSVNFLRSMRCCVWVLLFGVLQACSTLVATPPAPGGTTNVAQIEATKDAALAAWSRVLAAYVNDQGLVDFAGLAQKPADLHTYVNYVARVKTADISDPQERLAHHLNTYNALSMFNVLDLGIPLSNASLVARYKFFIARKHVIGGEPLSLYTYENATIRKLNEPRIHWALNCSALSCPVLPREPFTAAALQMQLERESKKFFADPRNMRVDDATRTVYLTEIMSFFTEDFTPAHAPNLIAYANRYAPKAADTSYSVRFVPYDWTIANWKR